MPNTTFESLVADNQTDVALEELEKFLSNLQDRYLNQVTLLKSRLVENNQNNMRNTIGDNQFSLEKNRINYSFLDLLGNIRNDLSKNFTFLQSAPAKPDDYKRSIMDYVESRSKGKYKITTTLKEGPSVANFLAFDNRAERKVVIKVLKMNYFINTQKSIVDKDFCDEVKKVKNLKHRNIIKIQDIFLDESPYFVVIDYVWGISVSDLIKSIGSIPFYMALEILLEVCEVLDYLRYRKIFHTAIRPDKILLDEENKAMLSPFEVIKAGSAERSLKKFEEDCLYLSPELLEMDTELDKEPDTLSEAEQNDQFSMGLIAYEMLTGEPLFAGEGIPDIILKRNQFFNNSNGFRESKWKKLREAGCPSSMIQIIKKMLNKKPGERHPNMWQLNDKLHKLKPALNSRQRLLIESYNRCLAARPDFTELFYNNFFKELPEIAKLFPEENRERQFKMLQLAQRAFLDSGEDDSFIKRMPNIKGHKGVRFEQYEAFNRAMQNTIAMADPRWNDTDISGVWQETSKVILLKLKKVLEGKSN